MKLKQLRIQNFRSFVDETIQFDDYTCLVGPNSSGKSNILSALNVFFRNNLTSINDNTRMTEEDFYRKNIEDNIVITVTFDDLSDEAKEDFRTYVRHDLLTVRAVASWNAELRYAEVKQKGERLVNKDFSPFFKADSDGERVPTLKDIYNEIRKSYEELPKVSTKQDMISALREYEEAHIELCENEVSDDQFYGWSKGANLMAKHIQWIYVPAVKDASSEQDEAKSTALGQLLERTIRNHVDFSQELSGLRDSLETQYQSMLEENQNALDDISSSLQNRLRDWSKPDTELKLEWSYDRNKTLVVKDPFARVLIGDQSFLSEVARLGHGVQRSFIIALLQELAVCDVEAGPRIILGIEEPELFQHPPQARYFANLLEELSEDSSQIIATSHSPYFISGRGFEAVRAIRPGVGDLGSKVNQLNYAEMAEVLAAALGKEPSAPTVIMAAVEQILQPSMSEMFFADMVVFVEGVEDVAYLTTYMQITDKWNEFRKNGGHFVLAGGKTNMSRLVAIANGLQIPRFVVFDGDVKPDFLQEQGPYHDTLRDNSCLLKLLSDDDAPPLTDKILWGKDYIMWPQAIYEAVANDVSHEKWERAEHIAKTMHGLEVGVKRKNTMLISATLHELMGNGDDVNVLKKAVENILAHP